MNDIIINLHGKDARVDKDEYITAKHLDLVENFGNYILDTHETS